MSTVVSCLAGRHPISPTAALRALLDNHQSLEASIFLGLRLPRAACAFVAGGLLALSGVLMQVLLRNPLADPYVLGISGGASVGALTAILSGAASQVVSGAAFFGALVSMLAVIWVANGVREGNNLRLLLSGVVMAAGWSAVVNLLLMWAPEARLRAMVFWLTGDLGQAASLGWVPTVLGVGTGLAWLLSASLNVLARGELQAKAAGAPVGGMRLAIYLGASLLTSNAVTIAGSVGFVGLLVPHMIRLVIGADHRVVVPGSVLLGGTLLVVADFLAREALWPLELPVGIVTAVIGVPVFLLLLRRT